MFKMRQRAQILQVLLSAGLVVTTIGCGTTAGSPSSVKSSTVPIAATAPIAPKASVAPSAAVTVKDDDLDANIMAKVTEKKPQLTKAPVAAPPPVTDKSAFKIIKPEDLDPDNLPIPFAPDSVDRSDGDVDITAPNAPSIGGGLQTKTVGGGKDIPIDLFLRDPRAAQRARFWGIHTAYDLLQAGRSPFRRWVLKFKLGGLFYPRYYSAYVLYWVEQADLLRIPGVNPQYAFMLQMSGITSVPDLARWAFLDQLAIYTNMGTVALTYGIYMPSFTEFKSWVEAARGLPPVIY